MKCFHHPPVPLLVLLLSVCVSFILSVTVDQSLGSSEAAARLKPRAIYDRSCPSSEHQQVHEVLSLISLVSNKAILATDIGKLRSNSTAADYYYFVFKDLNHHFVSMIHGTFREIYFQSLQAVMPEEADRFATAMQLDRRRRRALTITCIDSEHRCQTSKKAYLGSDGNTITLVCAIDSVPLSFPGLWSTLLAQMSLSSRESAQTGYCTLTRVSLANLNASSIMQERDKV